MGAVAIPDEDGPDGCFLSSVDLVPIRKGNRSEDAVTRMDDGETFPAAP